MTLADVPVFVLQLNLKVSPMPTIRLLLLIEILVGSSTTVILQVAVFPLEVFAVIVAVPTDFAVTFPFDIVATLVLLYFQVTVLSVAFAGVTVAFKLAVFPTFIDKAVLFNDILFTSIAGSVTVILQVAVFPLEVFAVIVAVPTDFAVTFPFDTVTILVSLDCQVTVLSVASSGVTIAFKL